MDAVAADGVNCALSKMLDYDAEPLYSSIIKEYTANLQSWVASNYDGEMKLLHPSSENCCSGCRVTDTVTQNICGNCNWLEAMQDASKI